MFKNNLHKIILLLFFLVTGAGGWLYGQDTLQNLYSISFKQEFSSWGDCRNNPYYDHADITLIAISGRILSELNEIVQTDRLTKLIYFNKDFFSSDSSKSEMNMVDSNNFYFSQIKVHAYINDMTNDDDFLYSFYGRGLSIGENTISHSASDPCNNLISNNREGYTITTNVYIDDPIHLTNNSEIYRFNANNEYLTLNVGDYFNYNNTANPILQVALSNTDEWYDISEIKISPNSTLELGYSKIAGIKTDPGSHYYAWIGKNLKFRVVKTLMNGKKTFGQIVDGIVFYPDGLQFSILQTRRTACDDNVSIYVKLEDGADKGYFSMHDYSWNITDSVLLFDCEMINTDEPLIYLLITKEDGMPVDPFSEPNLEGKEWTLQLIEKTNPKNKACTKTFTIPPKPEPITITQIKNLYPINGTNYDVPDMNNPYVLLNIDDPYEFSFLRMPYVIKEGETVLDSVNSLPDTYTEMLQPQKDSMDALFNSEFSAMLGQSANPYRNYFEIELKKLLRNNPVGTQIPLPYNFCNSYMFANDGSFFLFESNSTIFKVKINNDGTYATEQKSNFEFQGIDLGGISPDNSTLIYTLGGCCTNATIWKTKLNTSGISYGSQVLLPYNHSITRTTIKNPDIFFDNQNILIGLNPWSGGEGLYKINIEDGTYMAMYLSGVSVNPTLSPDNSFVYFRRNSEWYKGTITRNSVSSILTKICDGHTLIMAKDGSFAVTNYNGKTNKVNLTGAQAGTILEALPYEISTGEMAFNNAGKCIYYYSGTAPNYEVDRGLYLCTLNGNPGSRFSSIQASDLTIAPNGTYIIYQNSINGYTYKLYLGVDEAATDLYPDKGAAFAWHNNFRAIYKQKWLSNRLGVKISNGIQVNQPQPQTLTLTDADGCDYSFDIDVKAPPHPNFRVEIISYPGDACAKNGKVRVTYNGGGSPPYISSTGTLSTINNFIDVSGMRYGDNYVYFTDSYGKESYTLPVTIGSATVGITSTSIIPQTCATPNGSVTVNVGNVINIKTYKLTCDYPYKVYTYFTSSNSYQFTNLPAGNYTAEVTSGTCYFKETNITVGSQIFEINLINTTDAITMDGTGGVSLSFTNRTNSVNWVSGVPSVFRTSENTNTISYTDVEPQTYNYVALNVDAYDRTCQVSGSFTINKPSFGATIILEENTDSCAIQVSLTSGNSLITPFNIRLLNSSGELVVEGGNENPLSAFVSQHQTYTINLQYDTNTIDIYSFAFPQAPINNDFTLAPPSCAGEKGSILINPTGGIDGQGFQYSLDGLSFSNTNSYAVKGGEFTYFIKDQNTSYPIVFGNTLMVNKSIINRFEVEVPEPIPVSAEKVIPINVTCAGFNNGSVSIGLLNGGSGYYQYRVDDGAWFDTISTITGISAGSHDVYLRDSQNNCPAVPIRNISISQPDSLKFSEIEVMQSTCNSNNAFIRVGMIGGTKPYSYLWKDFYGNIISTDTLIDKLEQSGYYFLEVADIKMCTQHFEQSINPSNGPVVKNVEINQLKCFGDTTGSAKITEIEPATPFAPWWLTWSNGSITDSATGLSAGLHFVSITDTNKCVFTNYFSVTSPDKLHAEITDSRDACFGENDGFIKVEGRGGVGDYNYSWSNGEASNLADSLRMGSYTVQITDANQCQNNQLFTISQFDKVVADLGNDIAICPGNTINLDGMDFTTHKWSTSKGVLSDERFISVNSQNEFYLEVTDDIGCLAYDTLLVTIGNDALKADFLMTSEAFFGDTLYLFELSNMELDSLKWGYDINSFRDITESNASSYVLQLENNDTGIFNVKLLAYSGGCISQAIKQVEIIYDNDTTEQNDELGYKDPLITSFVVSPNPNEGTFNVDIGLREESDIRLVIFSVSFGRIINDRKEYGLKDYELKYNLDDLNEGAYVIIITTANERRQVKMIVL